MVGQNINSYKTTTRNVLWLLKPILKVILGEIMCHVFFGVCAPRNVDSDSIQTPSPFDFCDAAA